ncbi:MAG: hypothetical protein ABIQ88_11715 [Chitinophagaceae bacterium]
MKKLLVFFCVAAIYFPVTAQKNFAEAMQQGDTAFSNGQFKTAINKYFAAEAFDPSKKGLVKERVNRVFDNVEMLRREAETARIQALTEKDRAEKAEQAQASQTKIVLNEKSKLQTLNDFMKYNNRQLFDEITRNRADLLDLKKRESQLLSKYGDSSEDESYRFFSLFLLSQYYQNNHDFQSAFKCADSLCRKYPDSALSFLGRSVVNYYLGNWENAIVDTDTALLINKYEELIPVLKWNKALALSNLGKHGESRKLLNEAMELLRTMPEDETWSDDFVAEDISKATEIYIVFMKRDYQLKTLEIYALVNSLYEGSLAIEKLEQLNRKELNKSILLSVINYTSIHLKALPDQYVGYLVKGYMWELANYPEQAKINYLLFLEQNKKQAAAKYSRYKNNFSSPLYNQLKK